MAYKAPDIGTLSAHDYNKIRTSFDAFKKTQGKYQGENNRYGRSQFDRIKGEQAAARQSFKKGGTYGIEDEYRYMVSRGFNPASMAIGSGQASEEAEETVKVRSEQQGEPCHYEEVGSNYVVYRTSDKKVMKSINYFRPDLSKFFNV